jgi:hypothetical protein
VSLSGVLQHALVAEYFLGRISEDAFAFFISSTIAGAPLNR